MQEEFQHIRSFEILANITHIFQQLENKSRQTEQNKT